VTQSTIVFKEIVVKNMSGNSGVFVGNNVASLWGSLGKSQTGFQADNSRNIRNRTYFQDNDVFDTINIGPAVFRDNRIRKGRPQPAVDTASRKDDRARPGVRSSTGKPRARRTSAASRPTARPAAVQLRKKKKPFVTLPG